MPWAINETHDPRLRSWVESANQPDGDFPIQNLPFGVFRRAPTTEPPRIGVAIGDSVLDLAACARVGSLDDLPPDLRDACRSSSLNVLMALGSQACSPLRRRLSELLGERQAADSRRRLEGLLVPLPEAELLLPANIGDYSDFYASIHHATNVGRMLRPDQPLMPNYKFIPVGYHGRASSIVVSGAPVRRPSGQVKDEAVAQPEFRPTRALDYELEVGFFVGSGNSLGEAIPIDAAEGHVFGLCLLNDWSARDIQKWEYQPLGPFLAKSFATTISPWVVTLEALAPFRVPVPPRAPDDPQPLPYLDSKENRQHGGLALGLEVWLSTEAMRRRGAPAVRVSRGDFRELYWTMTQLLTHHASNGCNLRPGDLLGSGTVSGPSKDSRGCLLELTWRGTEPLELPGGGRRRFLEDGDEVILRGRCEREGFVAVGFGECRGLILPARGA